MMVSPAQYAKSIIDIHSDKLEELLYPLIEGKTFLKTSTLTGDFLDKYAKIPTTAYYYGTVYNAIVRKIMWILKKWCEQERIEIYEKNKNRILYKIIKKEE